MTRLVPDQEWWTAEEIAAAALPDLPGSRQGVEAIIKRHDWRGQAAFARRRSGRGGGWEYSWQLFPPRARRKLLSDKAEAVQPERRGRDEVWQWYETLPAAVQARALERLKIVQQVEALEPREGRDLAVSQAPVILIGEEVLPQKLQRWERVSSRVLGWVGMAEATAADVVHLARLYAPTVAISPDLQARILRASRGSIRNVSTNLAGISEFAAARGLRKLDLAAWGDRPFHTGEVPPPRYVAVGRAAP